MTLAIVRRFPDPRLERVVVNRSALRSAAENAVGASRSAQDAVDRAMGHVWSGNRAAAIRDLERVGFEVGERLPALLILAGLAEKAPVIHDGCGPNGRAA